MKQKYQLLNIRLLTFLKLCIFLGIIISPNAAHSEISLKDDLGRIVTLESSAKKVIGLYSAYAQIFIGMNMQDILIARTSTDLRYIVLSHLPSIGTHMRPNLELIVGIGPDLVLQMGGREEAVQTVYDLERLGITVAYFSVSTFEDLFRVIKQMGVLTSSEDAATDLERKMRERLAAVSMALAMTHERPSVFFEVRSPNLLTVGKQSLVTEIIEKAGGINCIKSNRKLLRINDEEVFRLSPDYYILQKGPMNQTPVPMTHRPRMSRLEAVIKGRWQIVEENLFSRPGPGNVEAVEQLAKILHPTSFQNEPKQ